jgi:hypothetical protein
MNNPSWVLFTSGLIHQETMACLDAANIASVQFSKPKLNEEPSTAASIGTFRQQKVLG